MSERDAPSSREAAAPGAAGPASAPYRSGRQTDPSLSSYRSTFELPAHLSEWQLPPGWRWGAEGVWIGAHRFSMEVIDSLDRSLSLVTAPNAAHARWLFDEARHLGHLHHRVIPTTYHFWNAFKETGRGPGYLRHWIAGEPLRTRLARQGADDIPTVLRLLRELGSVASYLHDRGWTHGALSPDSVWSTPVGEWWILGWQWAMPRESIPPELAPDRRWMLAAPEWADGGWNPTPASDQWQVAAICLTALTGEQIPSRDIPPVRLVRPETPAALARVLDRALSADPADRYPSTVSMLRDVDRGYTARGTTSVFISGGMPAVRPRGDSVEERLRWALGDDYEILSKLGRGTFGDVWRVRDLTLEREVAVKILHPHIANDARAASQFRREARLAAQLSHPNIVPIFDWDTRGGVAWFTMELMENGSLADLVGRAGPRPLMEVARAVAELLEGLAAAHASGILHRDLKPENVLIDRWRHWRIGDFGLASRQGQDRTGPSGTPAFAAPEQLLNEPQGPAVDCFSMAGIVLFALTGRAPFGDGEPAVILARQLRGAPDLSDAPEPVREWIARGLLPEPDRRWPDAESMRAAWVRIAERLDPGPDGRGTGRPAELPWWQQVLRR